LGTGRSAVDRAWLIAGVLTTGKQRLRAGLQAHCEVAETLATRLGLSDGVRAGPGTAFEQWNGTGLPNGLSGEAIPLSARIVFLAHDVEIMYRAGRADRVAQAVRARRGAAYAPALADQVLKHLDDLVAPLEVASPWAEVLRRETATTHSTRTEA
jgi:response regulator RpfG family c-di-GMP phosphodiesterase